MDYRYIYHGDCHCGNIEFALETDIIFSHFVGRKCTCTFCRAHSAKYVSDPHGRLSVEYHDKSLVSFYKFGDDPAEYAICKRCGVLTVAFTKIKGHLYASVNARAFSDYRFPKPVNSRNFHAESYEEKIERRLNNWVADVRVLERESYQDDEDALYG